MFTAEDVRYVGHCVEHARYIGTSTDILAIRNILRSLQVTVVNPYAITFHEQLQFKLVSMLVYLCMRRMKQLTV